MSTITAENYDDGVLVSSEQVPVPVEQVNRDAIEQRATDALAANRIYIARTNPTAAQTTAQVGALSQQINGVIRLLLNRLDGTD